MDDKELVAGLLRKDEAAQHQMDAAYRKRLFQTAVYFLGYADAEVEDVVQETFTIALRDLEKFEFRSSLYTWLNHICANRCFQRVRERRKMVLGEEANMEALVSRADGPGAQAAEREGVLAERKELLRRGMQGLNALCREIVGLRVQEEMSYVDLAKRLKVPIGTVMSRLARCQAKLVAVVAKLRAGHE